MLKIKKIIPAPKGSCIIHILYTGVLKNLKNNSGAKRLTVFLLSGYPETTRHDEEVQYPKSTTVKNLKCCQMLTL